MNVYFSRLKKRKYVISVFIIGSAQARFPTLLPLLCYNRKAMEQAGVLKF